MTEISKIYNALNDMPVNKLAASMFWKTPWWAEVKESVAFPVMKAVLEERLKPETVNIDYFKPPPLDYDTVNNNMHPLDRRGWILKYGNGEIGVITGYADDIVRSVNVRPRDRNRKPPWWVGDGWDGSKLKKQLKHNHRWWVLVGSEFRVMNQSATVKLRIK